MKSLIIIATLAFSGVSFADGHKDTRGEWAKATTNGERNHATVRVGAPEGEWGKATGGNSNTVLKPVKNGKSCPTSLWGRVTVGGDRCN